jgi:hypothetical protein
MTDLYDAQIRTGEKTEENELERAKAAQNSLVQQLYKMWSDARAERDLGDLGSVEYAKRDCVASAFRDVYLTARAAFNVEGGNDQK